MKDGLRFSIAFLSSALLTSGMAIALVPGAFLEPAAALCSAPQDYGQIVAREDPADPTSNNIRGTRSDVLIPNGNLNCQRVASVIVGAGPGGSFFEVGWVYGQSHCPPYNYYNTPRLFYWAKTVSGAVHCNTLPTPSPGLAPGDYQSFRGSDLDANGRWGAWWEGNEIQPNGVALGFSEGISFVNTERATSADNGYARWTRINEWHVANGWSNWDDMVEEKDSDPAFRLIEENAYTGKTVQ